MPPFTGHDSSAARSANTAKLHNDHHIRTNAESQVTTQIRIWEPHALDPPPFHMAVFDPKGGPSLNGDDLDSFIEWAATVPVAGLEVVRSRIAAAREDRSVFLKLVDQLWQLPTPDVSRHCLLLSVVGELRNPEAVKGTLRLRLVL